MTDPYPQPALDAVSLGLVGDEPFAAIDPAALVGDRHDVVHEVWNVVVIAMQSGLIAMLLVQRARGRRAEDQARARREELAHAQRVATIGELSASLAHEITQPLTAIAANAQAARRMLAGRPEAAQ